MKRAHALFVAMAAAVALVAACDQRTPLNPNIKGGGGGGGSVKGAPVVSIDTVRPSPVNIGDSIFLAIHIRGDSSLSGLQINGLTVKGSVQLGTLTTSNRYVPINVPAGGSFRARPRSEIALRATAYSHGAPGPRSGR